MQRMTAILFGVLITVSITASTQSQTNPRFPGMRSQAGISGASAIGDNSAGSAITPPATGPSWTLYAPTLNPDTGLSNTVAGYDPATNGLIVFSGTDAGLSYADTNAVLIRSGANGAGTWSTLIANGTLGSPPARTVAAGAYDPASNRLIVFGGCGSSTCSTVLNDVWVLSNANGQGGSPVWTQLNPTGSLPSARSGHTAVYDQANNRLVVFGGATISTVLSDAWVLSNANGIGGTPAWTQLMPTGTNPSGLYAATAVYDPNNNVMTVFSGVNQPYTALTNGAWTLSNANGLGGTPQWTNIVANGGAGAPPKRFGASAVYDVVNNRMTIFGGYSSLTALINGYQDAWVLSFANGLGGTPAWTHLKPAGSQPGPREGQSAVYDAINNRMIVFGGFNTDAQFYGVWVLNHANGL